MRDEHITKLLEGVPPEGLGERELALIRDHTLGCAACRRAYRAARISSLLLTERAAVRVEPSPFFETRVLAALRGRAAPEPSTFERLWRAAWLQVLAMTALVLLLGALTLVGPAPESAGEVATEPTEMAVFALDEAPAEELSYGQVLTTLYEPDGEAGR